jgi:multifunctional methyltransferase subunit TRM112
LSLTTSLPSNYYRSTKEGYPLRIEPSEVVVEDSPFDAELVSGILPKLNYPAIVGALKEVVDKLDPKPVEIPESLPDGYIDSSTLEALYHVLFNIHIIEGELVCPDTGRKFPIKQGIPNMILHEDEI